MSRPVLPAEQGRALKLATKALLAACGGGEAASSACRLGPSHLSEAAGMHHLDRWAPIDVVAALESVAEDMPVTRALARLQGCIVVPIAPRGAGTLAELLAKLGREVGDVFAAAALGLADGALSEAEAETLRRELVELVAAGQAALGALSPVLPVGGAK